VTILDQICMILGKRLSCTVSAALFSFFHVCLLLYLRVSMLCSRAACVHCSYVRRLVFFVAHHM
jgi:hypothetical protein